MNHNIQSNSNFKTAVWLCEDIIFKNQIVGVAFKLKEAKYIEYCKKFKSAAWKIRRKYFRYIRIGGRGILQTLPNNKNLRFVNSKRCYILYK